MLGKEKFYASMCILSGVVVAMGVFIALGGGPSPVLSMSMILIGLGAALVIVRYGRLGPYQGQFGPPPVETVIRDRITRETERAVRYNREFSILALRDRSRRTPCLATQLRGVDDVIHCWKGVTLLILPETSRDGAMQIYHRIGESLSEPAVAALVSCPADGVTPDQIASRLLTLLRADAQPGTIAMGESEPERARVAAY